MARKKKHLLHTKNSTTVNKKINVIGCYILEIVRLIPIFQKESVVCGRRIGIRKGSGDIVYDPRPEDPIVQLKLPGKQAREE